ncbi:UDP-N-acetyl-D-mannosamine dehydrogenase [uncultured archaeon]|nr:UDP-N-acetyl-D-mannosamine dehydrogenase [uncultured archaeon]
MHPTKICVIGLGQVGLPTAALLASRGNKVLGVDLSPKTVKDTNAGQTNNTEPGLKKLLKSAVKTKKLAASTKPSAADIFIILVPTQATPQKTLDIKPLKKAVTSIAKVLEEGNLVLLQSTVPPQTTKKVDGLIRKIRPDLKSYYLAYCPERVLPGRTIKELTENNRIIGGLTTVSTKKAAGFYKTFVTGKIELTDAPTAELCKLAENAFRNVNIAFANELSMICDAAGGNAWEVIRLANTHPRVKILTPGPGVGGRCLAANTEFLKAAASEKTPLIKASRQVNEEKTRWVTEKIRQTATNRKNPVIGCLGITYKADVSGTSGSPAMKVIDALRQKKTGKIIVCDPHATRTGNTKLLPLQKVLSKSNIIAILVAHKEFKNIRKKIRGKEILDFCGALE